MNNFEQAQADAWAANISEDSGLAEEVTVTKFVGGAERTIWAIINRNPPEKVDSAGRVTRPVMTALVRNDATDGYALSEMNNNDTITVAYRYGVSSTAKPYNLRLADEPGAQDAATLLLDLG